MSEELKRTQIARDESERLLRALYRIVCGSPAFARAQPDLDNAIRAHLLVRESFADGNGKARRG